MDDDEPLGVDDLVIGRAAEQMGDGVIPAHAILIVETMSEDGAGLRYIMSQGTSTWHAMGLLRAATNKIEADDLDGWAEGE